MFLGHVWSECFPLISTIIGSSRAPAGSLRRRLRDEAGPRRDGGGLRQGRRQGLLDREELVGHQVGRGRLHPDEEERGRAHGQVRHRHGRFVPGEERPQPDGDGSCLGPLGVVWTLDLLVYKCVVVNCDAFAPGMSIDEVM